MTAGVGKARPPRSFPTGLAKYLRPEAQTQTVAKPRTWEKAAFLASRLLNHSRFPDGRAHGFAAPLRVALPPPVASAHRAHASLRAFGRSQRSGKRCGIRLWGAEGKRRPRSLPGEAQSAPQVRRREVSALWAVAAKGGKATRRREQIPARGQRAERRYLRTSKPKGCARSARTAPIFAKGRKARMMEQPMIPLRPAPCQPHARPALPGGQTVEKPLILGRAAFLAPFRRSQRLQEMLRHKALGLCPKPRQGPEAPAPRPLSTSCARPALPGGAFLCPFHSPRNVIHYTQPFFPAA